MKSKNAEERMTLLCGVIDDIMKNGCVDETDSSPSSDLVKSYWDRLCTVYEDPEFRHSYSVISKQLEEYDPEQRDSLPIYINHIVAFAELQEDQEYLRRIIKAIKKLQDHLELECIRLNRMRQVEHHADEAKRIQNEAMVLNKSTKKAAERLNKRVDGFHEQSITILGIFSAVVVGFMADLSMFTSGFDKLTSENVYTITFYSVAVGIIVFDTLFMMIFFISKISGHDIARESNADKAWKIPSLHKYPYVYAFNVLALLMLGVLKFLQLRCGTIH